jgi:hypothetical protein
MNLVRAPLILWCRSLKVRLTPFTLHPYPMAWRRLPCMAVRVMKSGTLSPSLSRTFRKLARRSNAFRFAQRPQHIPTRNARDLTIAPAAPRKLH